jgi:hypothetical protein
MLIWPSAWPLLHASAKAFLTASTSRANIRANCCRAWMPERRASSSREPSLSGSAPRKRARNRIASLRIREFLVGKQQLADDLKIWLDAPAKRKADALLTGMRLTRAQHWLAERSTPELAPDERAFIGKSVEAAESARRRRKGFVAASMALLMGFSLVAGYQTLVALRETQSARKNAELANKNAVLDAIQAQILVHHDGGPSKDEEQRPEP